MFLVQESDKEGAVDVITIRQVDNEEIEFDPSTLRLLDSGPTPKFEFAVTGKAFGISFNFCLFKNFSLLLFCF